MVGKERIRTGKQKTISVKETKHGKNIRPGEKIG